MATTSTDPRTDPTTDPTTVPGDDPAEGRSDMRLPGADREAPAPDRQAELPQRLGERIDDKPGEGGAIDDPDLLPNVEAPESSM